MLSDRPKSSECGLLQEIFKVCRRYRPGKGNVENGNRQENTNEAKGDNETDSQETNMYLEKKNLVDTHKTDECVIIKETTANDRGRSSYCEESRNQESNFI
jgi:hypothetical protein